MGRMMMGAVLAALAAAEAGPPQYRVIETGVQAQPTAFNNAGEIVFPMANGFDAYAQAAIWSAGALSSPRPARRCRQGWPGPSSAAGACTTKG